MKTPIILPGVAITKFTSEGHGIAHINGKIHFVEDAIPGDTCTISIYKSKKDHAFARAISIETPAEARVLPYCSHYDHCGGCRLQHVSYSAQLALKHQSVVDAMQHIGKLENLPEVLPTLPCEPQQYYRNKLEYTFSNKRFRTEGEENTLDDVIGFHVSGAYNKVLDINHCYHQATQSNDIRNGIRSFALAHNYSFYDLKNHTGLLRTLMLRNTNSDEWMVVVVFAHQDNEAIASMMQYIKTSFPYINSLQYVVNTKKNDTLFDQEIIPYSGENYIHEKLGEYTFTITAKSFFQVNIYNTTKLYDVVLACIGNQKDTVVYDLYCGTGTIGIYCSKNIKKLIGIDITEEAIVQAKENAKSNGVENATFVAGDMKDVFNETFYATHGNADVMIVDPPRAGLHGNVTTLLLHSNCPKIVYVSCNPATQARDVALLSERYAVELIQPVDMFPNTLHLENVMLLTLKK